LREPPRASGGPSSRTCCTCRCRDATASAAIRINELSHPAKERSQAVDGAWLVIEAVPERIDVKTDVLGEYVEQDIAEVQQARDLPPAPVLMVVEEGVATPEDIDVASTTSRPTRSMSRNGGTPARVKILHMSIVVPDGTHVQSGCARRRGPASRLVDPAADHSTSRGGR
jgi:hypothetical protein